jgi:effector-binding domain-containing protein
VENLVPIGRFARITGLSVKALRHYDQLGLLTPAEVDAWSSYRYYRLSQCRRAEAIRQLRRLDMPLPEVRRVLVAWDSEDALALDAVLDEHAARMSERLERTERSLAYLQRLIDGKEDVMPYDVQVKEVAPQPVAAIRDRVTLSTIGDSLGRDFGEVFGYLGRSGIAPAGPPLIVYPDEPSEDGEFGIEVCVPVAKPVERFGRVEPDELPGGSIATTTHHGPYEELRPAYHAVAAWVQEHGHQLAGPPREVYTNSPGQVADPSELETIIEWPIR